MANGTERSARRWKHPVRDGLVVVGVLALGWMLYPVWWALTARPNPTVDYVPRLAELIARHQPAGAGEANAWGTFLGACAEMRRVYEEASGSPSGVDPVLLIGGYETELAEIPEGPGREQLIADLDAKRELAERVVAGLDQTALPALMAEVAATMRAEKSLPSGSVFNILLPELSDNRDLARLWKARMLRLAGEGDGAGAARAFEEGLALARVVAHQGFLVNRFSAAATAQMTVDGLHQMLDVGALDSASLRLCHEAIERHWSWPAASVSIETERIGVLDLMQRCFTDDGRGGGRLIVGELEGTFQQPYESNLIEKLSGGFRSVGRAQTARDAERYYDLLGRWADTPRRERGSVEDPGAFLDGLPATQVFLHRVATAPAGIRRVEDTWQCVREATVLRLAIEEHRLAHGALPATLEELVPGVLDELPRDVFSADGRFVYRVEQAGRYTLYSVGWDGEDDGGAGQVRDGLEIAPRAMGADYVVTRP